MSCSVDVGTLLRCYTQADNNTMLAVMNELKKVTERPFPGDFTQRVRFVSSQRPPVKAVRS